MKRVEQIFTILSLLVFTNALIALLLPGSRGQQIFNLIVLAIYLISAGLLLLRLRLSVNAAARIPLIWVGLFVALASILWSVTPWVTQRRDIALIGTTLFALYFASRFTLREQLRLLAWAFGIAAFVSLLFVMMLPSYGISSAGWRGIYHHKNTLGQVMAVSSLVFLLVPIQHRWKRWIRAVGFLMSAGLLLMSSSKTALVLLLTTLLVLQLSRILRTQLQFLVPILAAVLSVAAYVTIWVSDHYEVVLDAVGRDTTLTGRTQLWSAVLEMISERPWLGYGAGAFWRGWDGPSGFIWFTQGWHMHHSHNGYLDLWLDLGLVGLSVFLFILGIVFIQAILWYRSTTSSEATWVIVFLSFLVIYNFSESVILMPDSIFWVLFVSVGLHVAPRRWLRRSPTRGSRFGDGTGRYGGIAPLAHHLS